MHDDRAEFEEAKRRSTAALAADSDLLHRAADVQIDAAGHRYTYLWSWLGLPIIQLPPDVVALQEIVWETRPDVLIETGVARGGSLALFATVFGVLGRGVVVGVDVDIRPHNRAAIEQHPLAPRIRLVEGSSTDEATLAQVRALIPHGSRVMVVLDSDHSHAHVLAELRAYAPLVTPGQFLVVADTGLGIPEAARMVIRDWGPQNNPMTAMNAYLAETNRFEIDPFYNGKLLLTSNPRGYLRCIAPA
ncbi:MAG TPA: CmcI family methyltransferase [Candidatus Elarobacter sp.]